MNLLIIDDEPIILSAVYNQIKNMGFALNHTDCANNTTEADKLMAQREYDIFLCDIEMPGEDGISFAKRVLNKLDSAIFIFLTAHADFKYMKEAISMNSFEYILQPASEEELRTVLERAMMQVAIEKNNKKLEEIGSMFQDYQMDILDGNAMRYLIGLTQASSFLEHLIEQATKKSFDNLWYIPVFSRLIEWDKEWNEDDRGLLRAIYYNVVDELTTSLKSQNVILLRSDTHGNFILLLCFEKFEDISNEQVASTLDNMRIIFNKTLKRRVSFFYSEACKFMELRQACMKINAETEHEVVNADKTYRVGELSGIHVDVESIDQQANAWKLLLDNKQYENFWNGLDSYTDRIIFRQELNKDYIVKIHQKITELILTHMVNNNINTNVFFDEELQYSDFMYCTNTLEEFKDTIRKAIDRLIRISYEPGKDIIQDIMRYVEDNIQENILVSEIADYIGMNPEYMTRFFKKHKGMPLKQYIEKAKMDSAKTLLTQSDIPITLVAEKVGYLNYSNFTKSFKKYMGVTPSEYRIDDKN